ncbi:hypothetical protein ACMC9I_02645 [Deinococcota bacterium DY0809b]
MNGSRWYAWLPALVFFAAAALLGLTAWELRQAQLEEGRLRGRFEELLRLPETLPKRAAPLDPAQLPEVYRELIGRALELGLEVREVNPGIEDGLLIVEGGFQEAYAMLEAVRAMDRPLWVKGIEINRLDDEGRRLSVTYTLGVRIAPPEDGFGADGAP